MMASSALTSSVAEETVQAATSRGTAVRKHKAIDSMAKRHAES
jgi:ribosomal protein S7